MFSSKKLVLTEKTLYQLFIDILRHIIVVKATL